MSESDWLNVNVPGLAPGESVAPEASVVRPPTVPVPPSVAPEATPTAPVASDWSPLIRRAPAETVVAPV